MLIAEFFGWARQASAGERAEAASALAKAYLYADLDPIDRGDAERALTALLDDPAPVVRRALAEALATATEAPPHILLALIADRADIAAMVLERSPALGEAELVDAVALGEDLVQAAVARRPIVSATVAAALAEVGGPISLVTLCRNGGALLDEASARRIVERLGSDGRVRDALAGRADLSAETRHALVVGTATALADFVQRCGWMGSARARRTTGEARDRATILIGAEGRAGAVPHDLARFAAYLHACGHLTPVLLMRTLMNGHLGLFEAALAELSGKGSARIAGLSRNPDGLGFAALCKAAGLPPELVPAIRAALRAVAVLDDKAPGHGDPGAASRAALDSRVVAMTLRDCAAHATSPRVTALLRRFEMEAAREAVRDTHRLPAVRPASPHRADVPVLGRMAGFARAA